MISEINSSDDTLKKLPQIKISIEDYIAEFEEIIKNSVEGNTFDINIDVIVGMKKFIDEVRYAKNAILLWDPHFSKENVVLVNIRN